MIITYHGDSYFKLQAGSFIVLVDPTNQRSFKGAGLVINTLKPAAVPISQDESAVWIDHQGEYEVRGVEIRGWSNGVEKDKEKTVYRLVMDEFIIGLLNQANRPLPENIQEHFRRADIILGIGVKDGGWVRQLEPAIIVPAAAGKDMEKLVIKKKDITPGKTKIICLSV